MERRRESGLRSSPIGDRTLSGKELVGLTKEKVREIGEISFRIVDKKRGGYYEIKPVSKTKLATILGESKVTMKQLREGDIDLKMMAKLEEEICQAGLGWVPPDDMKEPLAFAILDISNLGVTKEKLDEFFLDKPSR